MSLFDLSVSLLVVLFALLGFRNGIVREVMTLAGLAFAFLVTFRHKTDLAEFLSGFVDRSAEVLELVAAILLFSSVFALALILAVAIGRLLSAVRLNLVNRLFGLIFGGFKICFVVSAVLLLLADWGIPSADTRQASVLYPYLLRVVPWTFTCLAPFYPGLDNWLEQSEDVIDNIMNTIQ